MIDHEVVEVCYEGYPVWKYCGNTAPAYQVEGTIMHSCGGGAVLRLMDEGVEECVITAAGDAMIFRCTKCGSSSWLVRPTTWKKEGWASLTWQDEQAGSMDLQAVS